MSCKVLINNVFALSALVTIRFSLRVGTLMHYVAYNETASNERRAFKKSMQDTSFEKVQDSSTISLVRVCTSSGHCEPKGLQGTLSGPMIR